MHMFRCIFTLSSVSDCVKSTIRNVVPACLRLVSKHEVAAIVPSEPSEHLLREIPDILVGLLVQPMVKWAVEIFTSMSGDLLRELSF